MDTREASDGIARQVALDEFVTALSPEFEVQTTFWV
jgi:hypothetical protein